MSRSLLQRDTDSGMVCLCRQCRSLDSKIVLGALGPPATRKGRKLADQEKVLNQEFIQDIKGLGANLVVWNSLVTAEGVSQAHGAGLRVWVYTIDDPSQAKALIQNGVDGIITNDPEAIRREIGHTP